MANDIKYRDILYNNQQIGPFPSDKLKRVDAPTIDINMGPHKKRRADEGIGGRIARGELGEAVRKAGELFTISEPIGAAYTSVQRHMNDIRNNPVAEKQAPIPEDPRVRARHLKSLGYFLGAEQMGICEIPEWAWRTHDDAGEEIPPVYKYAVVFMCRKNAATTRVSDGVEWIYDPASFQAYQRLCLQTETMANYIRRLGHEADVSNMFTYQTLMPPLVLMAGLGENCKISNMLNPFLGVNAKVAAVLTNMELEVDKPIDFGLQDYCAKCNICKDVCPSGAIQGRKIEFNGYEWWELDVPTCGSFSNLNDRGWACGRCSKLCPWNFEDLDNGQLAAFWADWDGSIEDMHARVDKHAEELRARNFVGEDELTDKWWFDLSRETKEDRTLYIPKTTEQVDESYYKDKYGK